MAGYRQTRAAALVAGVDPDQVTSRALRRQVRAAGRQLVDQLPAAPKRAQARRDRKRVMFAQRIAAAATPGQRVLAVAAFLASALAEVPASRADQVSAVLVDQFKSTAEQLLKEASA